jgi:hypothetical protein
MTDTEEELRPLSSLLSLAQEAAHKPAAPELQRKGRERLLASAAVRSAERALPRPFRAWPAILTAACALAVAAWFVRPRTLSYEVRGGSAQQSHVGARADAPAEITFSDGSRVKADPGAQLRIADTRSDGARVLVERGVASAHVVHREHTSWLFQAGPFEVRVTGTKLRIAWDPAREELDLTLEEGSVEVRSPLGTQPIAVRAGQRFLARAEPSKHWTGQVVQAGSGASAEEAGANGSTTNTATTTTTITNTNTITTTGATRGKAQAQPPSHRDTWQSLVTRGEFEAVIAAATAKGVDGCLASCPATELRALADAARYTKRLELAEKCLLSLRERFAGSGPSAGAAFLLGRTSELRGRNAQAEHWYELYLGESADGEYASDALAGRMRVVEVLRGKAAARDLAVEYLRRYPDGVYASSARRIAGARK